MSEQLTVPPRTPNATFLDFPLHTDLDAFDAHVAILGLPYGDPYTIDEVTNDQTNAPTAVRVASARITQHLDRFDFDLGGPLLDGRDVRVVDCGDVPGHARDLDAHYRKAEAAAKKIFDAGALLVSIGGDHGVPIPVFRACEGLGPVTLVHVDAHLDWRDEVRGVREGYSNPIRRASEMPWIDRSLPDRHPRAGQRTAAGIRGRARLGRGDRHFLRGAGTRHAAGPRPHPRRGALLPEHRRRRRRSDGDAGGGTPLLRAVCSTNHVRALIHGLVKKGRVVGMDVVEITPARDVNEITSIVAGRFILNLIGTAVRAGYFEG